LTFARFPDPDALKQQRLTVVVRREVEPPGLYLVVGDYTFDA
jgi:hypothetical protein